MRLDGRKSDDLREVTLTRSYLKHPEGSVLIKMGETIVICTASLEERVPHFLKGEGRGWVTAEYGMLPRATGIRTQRESNRPNSRSLEIQRLIGRSLRSVINLKDLGERTIWIDCDVIQADGGTRTAAITGSFLALVDALLWMQQEGKLIRLPLCDYLAAVSVGLVDGELLLDLCFEEDFKAEVDMNVVMTGSGKLVEVQGTAEGTPFDRGEMDGLLDLATLGIEMLLEQQRKAMGKMVMDQVNRAIAESLKDGDSS